ncbi:hypothetical protein AK812_SmicGene451 [Symbiodinium microadriaticum]|uniref:Uncharacterized protein n=1 Tax=Symbiodinium microadriaticum TaxID=2951 RepID=A0A1Q9F6I6_SYMMI|nr:hypothetical protein AK812_SmicGene451 [Symbiodinium microadriaticum]CAE7200388.1 unnamed protein product [Symbiodinium microadriaticum]
MFGAKLGNQTFAAKRLLPSLEESEKAILKKRIAVIEAVQELVQTRDLGKLSEYERAGYVQLLSQNDVEASTSLRIKLTKLQAEKAAKDMVATKDDASIQRFLSIVVPFIKDDCEGFSYLNPTMNCIVLEGLNACFDTSSWGELALVPVVKQEPVDTDRCTDDDVDWEAIAEGLMRSFATSHVTGLLQAASASPDMVAFFVRFAEQVVTSMDAQRLPPEDELPKGFEHVLEVIRKISDWCRCIICLLSPIPNHLGSNVSQCETLLQTTSYEFLETELKDCLKNQEFWKGKFVEARKAASADAEYAAEIQSIISTMDGAGNAVQRFEAAKAAVQGLEDMKGHVREGGLAGLEAKLAGILVHVGKEVLQSDATATGEALCVDCDWLCKALSKFTADKADDAVPQLLLQLSEWKEVNHIALTKRELDDMATRASVDDADVNPSELARLIQILRKAGSSTFEEVKPKVLKLMQIVGQSISQKAKKINSSNVANNHTALKRDILASKNLLASLNHPCEKWLRSQLTMHEEAIVYFLALKRLQDLGEGEAGVVADANGSALEAFSRAHAALLKLTKTAQNVEMNVAMNPEDDEPPFDKEASCTDHYKAVITEPQPLVAARVQYYLKLVEEASLKLQGPVQGLWMADSDTCWKAKLDANADLQTVVEKGRAVANKMDGHAVQLAIDSTWKVLDETHKFLDKCQPVLQLLESGEEDALKKLKSTSDAIAKQCHFAKALVLEGMIVRALLNRVLKTRNTILTAQSEFISGLANKEQMEQLLHPLLLQAAQQAEASKKAASS